MVRISKAGVQETSDPKETLPCVLRASTMSSGRRRAPPPAPTMSTSSLHGGSGSSFDQLKTKYLNVDRNYETLKQLTRKGTLFLAGYERGQRP